MKTCKDAKQSNYHLVSMHHANGSSIKNHSGALATSGIMRQKKIDRAGSCKFRTRDYVCSKFLLCP